MNSAAPPFETRDSEACPYQALSEIESAGLHQFDLVRFKYLTSMAEKAQEQLPAVEKRLKAKLAEEIESFKADYQSANQQAAEMASDLTERAPAYLSAVKSAFKSHRIRDIRKLNALLSIQLPNIQSLRELTDLILHAEQDQPQDKSFDDFLKSQEDDILQSFFSGPSSGSSSGSSSHSESEQGENEAENNLSNTDSAIDIKLLQKTGVRRDNGFGELKSAKLFRDSWVKQNSEKVIERVIEEGPENPGPLNPEGQVIKTILAMREISPEYLNRFISYIDTLLWLEQALTEDIAPTKPKKVIKKKK